jgi:hypothetical protein
VYSLSSVTNVLLVAVVNQPLKVNPALVGIGSSGKVNLPNTPVCADVGETAPPCGLNVTVRICDHCAKIVVFAA